MGHVGADFGGLLKAMREARRISQSKLAERADFDHSYVSRSRERREDADA